MKCAIELNSVHEVEKFTAIVSKVDDDVWLVGYDENGHSWAMSAKSLLGSLLLWQKRKRNENAQHTMLTGILFIASAIKTSIA